MSADYDDVDDLPDYDVTENEYLSNRLDELLLFVEQTKSGERSCRSVDLDTAMDEIDSIRHQLGRDE